MTENKPIPEASGVITLQQGVHISCDFAETNCPDFSVAMLIMAAKPRARKRYCFLLGRCNGKTELQNQIAQAIFKIQQQPKLLHLALCSKKARVRKKNRNRILKEIKRF